jgi:glycosyltransferase involved in cell wall biosynthesis
LGRLDALLTDAWADPRSVFSVVGGRRRRDRFHEELRDATVWTPGVSSMFFEGSLRVSGAPAWDTMIERNAWFQDRACEQLAILARLRRAPAVLFAYSYAARRLFTVARAHGWTTVLGQIDPGPVEERLVARLQDRHPSLAADWRPAPASYWDNWREEWRLADRVVVNSEWSRGALCEAGVPESRIRIVPLAYEPTATPRPRAHAPRFDASRPLRVLFLGQVNLRKGVAEVLEAVEQLRGEPVHFTFVGPVQITLTKTMRDSAQISWMGGVAHSAAAAHFDSADVFLFPTHSDGFGLTQLEALAHGLPAIVSRHCARVITHGVNGIVLDEVSGAVIAASLRELLRDPSRLRAMSENARIDPAHSLSAVGRQLLAVVQ